MIRYGSVCSGIEAATVAWHSLGFKPVWFSEIENFPSAVLSHHYPAVPNYGDMTKFEEWPNEPIDLLVGGTPCQSFSVAGLRKGLDDPRGNLMLTYGAIARRYRPRWLVWENVPGVLSSNGGRDFGTFLGMLAECGYGFAYRILDAQFFGVAQRRRRVFVVANARSWQRAAAVLFESHSLQGHPAPSREKRQETARGIVSGVADVCPTLGCELAKQVNNQMVKNAEAFFHVAQNPMAVAHALTARMYSKSSPDPGAGRGGPVVVAQPVAIQGTIIGRGEKSGPNGVGADTTGAMFTLTKTDVHAVAQPVAFEPGSIARNAGPSGESVLAPTLRREMGDNQPAVRIDMQVRRLTPVECERLQGFPDGYTNIPWRKKPESPDGPRYKALGNSMAVPVMHWIGQRIKQVEEI